MPMPSGQPVFPRRVPDAYIAMRGLVVASLLILLVGGTDAFRICAFNAHRLTLTKVIKESVMDTLVQSLKSPNSGFVSWYIWQFQEL